MFLAYRLRDYGLGDEGTIALVRSRTDQLSEEDKLKEDKPTLTTL